MRKSPFTPDVCEFIRSTHKGISHKAMAEAINKKFQLAITERQILSFYKNHHLNSGLTGRYEKGSTPVNKGKRWADFMPPESQEASRKTCFKKGNRPHNSRPVGSEVVREDGYVWVKVAEPNKWREKHRILYEEYYGTIPPRMIVTFLDGNRQNFTRENLALITQEENKALNQKKLRFEDRTLTATGLVIAKLHMAMIQKERGGYTEAAIKAASEKSGIKLQTIKIRIKRGMSLEEAITTPLHHRR